MSNPQPDPAGNTQQFRAFAQNTEKEETAQQRPSYVLPITIAVVVIAVIAVGAFLLLG